MLHIATRWWEGRRRTHKRCACYDTRESMHWCLSWHAREYALMLILTKGSTCWTSSFLQLLSPILFVLYLLPSSFSCSSPWCLPTGKDGDMKYWLPSGNCSRMQLIIIQNQLLSPQSLLQHYLKIINKALHVIYWICQFLELAEILTRLRKMYLLKQVDFRNLEL